MPIHFRQAVTIISIHTPARGVTFDYQISIQTQIHFNPHSREGSDAGTVRAQINLFDISIHTPARGVTHTKGELKCKKTISIHTPARGVTIRNDSGTPIEMQFQSTLPRGE